MRQTESSSWILPWSPTGLVGSALCATSEFRCRPLRHPSPPTHWDIGSRLSQTCPMALTHSHLRVCAPSLFSPQSASSKSRSSTPPRLGSDRMRTRTCSPNSPAASTSWGGPAHSLGGCRRCLGPRSRNQTASGRSRPNGGSFASPTHSGHCSGARTERLWMASMPGWDVTRERSCHWANRHQPETSGS